MYDRGCIFYSLGHIFVFLVMVDDACSEHIEYLNDACKWTSINFNCIYRVNVLYNKSLKTEVKQRRAQRHSRL